MVSVELSQEELELRDRIVLTEQLDQVFVITMNRPERRNALGRVMRQGLRDAFDRFEADPSLRCAILTGTGTAFSAGGDLKEMAGSQLKVPPPEYDIMIGSTGTVSKPVIAAVNGFAFAGGFRLVQDCDLALSAESALFEISEVHRGRGAPWAAPLLNMVPQKVMMELLLTGDPISAARAYEVGLVNRVVPGDRLMDEALAMASRIAQGAPLSVAAAKKLVYISAEMGVTLAERTAGLVYESVYNSNDAKEGPRAFAAKRLPEWTGT
jgi:enoyl-CoA hydratase